MTGTDQKANPAVDVAVPLSVWLRQLLSLGIAVGVLWWKLLFFLRVLDGKLY